jgi:hypothetical protein
MLQAAGAPERKNEEENAATFTFFCSKKMKNCQAND